jgi:hypothetical protein
MRIYLDKPLLYFEYARGRRDVDIGIRIIN